MITVDPGRCSGCDRCEVQCSFFHSGKVGRSGARIKVVKVEELGIDFPVVCQHCREHYCIQCPEAGIEIGALGQVIISPTLCTACGICELLCPIGAIEMYEDVPYVCDLCGGDPRCVGACTMDAIHYEPGCTGEVSLEPFRKDSRTLNLEQRRLRYALASTEALRRQWVCERKG